MLNAPVVSQAAGSAAEAALDLETRRTLEVCRLRPVAKVWRPTALNLALHPKREGGPGQSDYCRVLEGCLWGRTFVLRGLSR